MSGKRIYSESPIRDMWNYLSVLSSETAALSFIRSKLGRNEGSYGLEENLLHEKARGIAFCIAQAKEYFQEFPERNLTTSALLYYYGTFSLFAALLLANASNYLTLAEVESFSKSGHGLDNFDMSGDAVSLDQRLLKQRVYLRKQGFLFHFLKDCGTDVTAYAFQKKLGGNLEWTEEEKAKSVSLWDLVARIPELRPIYDEIFDRPPLYFEFTLISRAHNGEQLPSVRFYLHPNSKHLSKDGIKDVIPFLRQCSFTSEGNFDKEDACFVAELNDEQAQKMRALNLYSSTMTTEVRIKPLLETIEDPLVFHFTLLYLISILVRYKPNVWREILSGTLDKYRALIAQYLRVVERVVPNLVLEKLYEKKFLFASISYWV